MDSGCLVSPMAWPLQFMLAALGAPGRFATSRPEALLAGHGYDAQVTQLGERGANFGRWPVPVAPRSVPNLPRCYLVRARRT